MMSFSDKIVEISLTLSRADVPFAFGGAVALSFHGQPRATLDIDLNIFLREGAGREILSLLPPIGLATDLERDTRRLIREGQVRLMWETTPVDLFFSTLPFHDSCAERRRYVTFAGTTIPILSAEDLTVCKIAFNRPKDWIDIADMLAIQGDRFDLGYVRGWLRELLGEDDPRIARFDALAASWPSC